MLSTTNENGQRTAVILPIEEYEELLEDLHVSRVAGGIERRGAHSLEGPQGRIDFRW